MLPASLLGCARTLSIATLGMQRHCAGCLVFFVILNVIVLSVVEPFRLARGI